MKAAKFMVLCVLVSGSHSNVLLGRDAQVTVKVIDKQKSPVSSMVILNPGQQRLGKTGPGGVKKFRHNCQTGQTFKAEPEDGAKYYNSEEEVCGDLVVLEVFPRPQAVLGWGDSFYIQKIKTPPGMIAGTVYAGVFGISTDTVESVTRGDKPKCKFTVDKKFKVAYYNTKRADWSFIPNDRLPQIGIKQDDVIYYFPSSCANALQQIGEIKKQINLDLKEGVMNYYKVNSEKISTTVIEAAKLPK